jgi:hypothetical protein
MQENIDKCHLSPEFSLDDTTLDEEKVAINKNADLIVLNNKSEINNNEFNTYKIISHDFPISGLLFLALITFFTNFIALFFVKFFKLDHQLKYYWIIVSVLIISIFSISILCYMSRIKLTQTYFVYYIYSLYLLCIIGLFSIIGMKNFQLAFAMNIEIVSVISLLLFLEFFAIFKQTSWVNLCIIYLLILIELFLYIKLINNSIIEYFIFTVYCSQIITYFYVFVHSLYEEFHVNSLYDCKWLRIDFIVFISSNIDMIILPLKK